MRRRNAGFHSLVALLAALALSACADRIAPIEPVATSIRIEPHDGLVATVGASIHLQVSFQGDSVPVLWQSSNFMVAHVDDHGIVIASGSGTAWIIAQAQPDLRDSVRITVLSDSTGHMEEWTITIKDVRRHDDGGVADRNAISGVIDVIVHRNIPVGVTGLNIRVLLNDQVPCTFTVVTLTGDDTCTINTAETVNGTRRFPNGPATLKAQLLGPNGVVIALATSPTLTISNP